MNRPTAISQLLRDYGDAFPSQLKAHCPYWTEDQIRKALQNGAVKGLCHMKTRVPNPEGRGWIAIWSYGPAVGRTASQEIEVPPTPRGEFGIGRVSSVWELAGQP